MMSVDHSGQIILWDFKASEVHSRTQAHFDEPIHEIQWMNKNFGSFAINSMDGAVTIQSIYQQVGQTTEDVVTGSSRAPASGAKPFEPTTHVPAWLAPKCGAAFGFGNGLVTFTSEGVVAFNEITPKAVDPTSEFIELYKNNQFDQICRQKEATAHD
jgi:hypothetical protein